MVAWIEAAGLQVQGMSNFGPNLVSFLLTPRERRWYIMGEYVLPNDVPTGHQVKQALTKKPPRVENILMGYLNSHLENPRDEREDDLSTILTSHAG